MPAGFGFCPPTPHQILRPAPVLVLIEQVVELWPDVLFAYDQRHVAGDLGKIQLTGMATLHAEGSDHSVQNVFVDAEFLVGPRRRPEQIWGNNAPSPQSPKGLTRAHCLPNTAKNRASRVSPSETADRAVIAPKISALRSPLVFLSVLCCWRCFRKIAWRISLRRRNGVQPSNPNLGTVATGFLAHSANDLHLPAISKRHGHSALTHAIRETPLHSADQLRGSAAQSACWRRRFLRV